MFKATVKSAGYPLLPGSTVSENLVQNLMYSDPAGNRVLEFDSVDDGDTLLLYKKGRYALEPGVSIEPVGAEYGKAVKVKENRKTGIRTLSVRKEAPVKLTKDGEQKIILINLVSVKKKSVTLKSQKNCTLAELFTEAYELLPDMEGEDRDEAVIIITDKKGVLFIGDGEFPAAGKDGTMTLRDFSIRRSGRRGSATVEAYFGGKVVKAKISCK